MPRRTYDWDEIRRLYVSGLTLKEVAAVIGCSKETVARVVNRDLREHLNEKMRRRESSGICVDCGGPCWRKGSRCLGCHNKRQGYTSAREDTLRCMICREWLPDQHFPMDRQRKARRERHPSCRHCLSERYRKGKRDKEANKS